MKTQEEMMTERWNARKHNRAEGVETLTVKIYDELKQGKVTDNKIMARFGMHNASLNEWKRNNNRLRSQMDIKPTQKVASKEKEVKPMNDVAEEQKPVVVDYKKFCETKDKEIAKLQTKNAELAEENNKLYATKQPEQDISIVDELKKEIKSLKISIQEQTFQKGVERSINEELTRERDEAEDKADALTKENEALREYRNQYESLEVEHAYLRTKYRAIENDLYEFKDTEQMLVQLMRRYTSLYDRVEESLEVER